DPLERPVSPRYDLIVIGGNAGGLSAAMVGRQSGMERVRILESDATVAFPDVLGEHGLDVGYGEKVVAIDVGEDGELVVTSDRQSYGARACLVADRAPVPDWEPPVPTIGGDRVLVDRLPDHPHDNDVLVV